MRRWGRERVSNTAPSRCLKRREPKLNPSTGFMLASCPDLPTHLWTLRVQFRNNSGVIFEGGQEGLRTRIDLCSISFKALKTCTGIILVQCTGFHTAWLSGGVICGRRGCGKGCVPLIPRFEVGCHFWGGGGANPPPPPPPPKWDTGVYWAAHKPTMECNTFLSYGCSQLHIWYPPPHPSLSSTWYPPPCGLPRMEWWSDRDPCLKTHTHTCINMGQNTILGQLTYLSVERFVNI